MSYTRENPQAGPADPGSASQSPPAGGSASSEPSLERSPTDRPRILEEHHIVGPHGEDEIEATDDRGRRWYHVRPDPRGRADLMGFNYTMWLFWILLIAILVVPWPGWGY